MTDDLIEAVAEAVWRADINNGGGVGLLSWADDIGDEPKNHYRCIAKAALDAVTASHTIVELPEPLSDGPDEVSDGGYATFPHEVAATYPNGRVWDQDADLSVKDAREIALSLLAAAVVAERTEAK